MNFFQTEVKKKELDNAVIAGSRLQGLEITGIKNFLSFSKKNISLRYKL